MVQVTHDEAQDHGYHAGDHVLHRKGTQAGSTQGDHGKEGAIVERQDRGGAHITLFTVLIGQGGIDDAVGVGHRADDGQGAQAQQPGLAEDRPHQQAQAETQEKLQAGEYHAHIDGAAGHLYIYGRAAAEQEQSDQGLNPPLEQAGGKAADGQEVREKSIDQTAGQQGDHHDSRGEFPHGT